MYKPEPIPGERTDRWMRSAFPGGLDGFSPNPSPVITNSETQKAQSNGASSSESAPAILFAYDFLIVP